MSLSARSSHILVNAKTMPLKDNQKMCNERVQPPLHPLSDRMDRVSSSSLGPQGSMSTRSLSLVNSSADFTSWLCLPATRPLYARRANRQPSRSPFLRYWSTEREGRVDDVAIPTGRGCEVVHVVVSSLVQGHTSFIIPHGLRDGRVRSIQFQPRINAAPPP